MPGPIIFKQIRVGRNEKLFEIFKFRTMRTGKITTTVTLSDDRRITFIGRTLRKTKVDELPQLWNVLKGDMSIVGPRPDVPEYVDRISSERKEIILSVRQGLTGLDSIAYPDEESLLATKENPIEYYDNILHPDKVRLNVQYVKNMNFWLDIRIILKTLFRQKFKEEHLS